MLLMIGWGKGEGADLQENYTWWLFSKTLHMG